MKKKGATAASLEPSTSGADETFERFVVIRIDRKAFRNVCRSQAIGARLLAALAQGRRVNATILRQFGIQIQLGAAFDDDSVWEDEFPD